MIDEIPNTILKSIEKIRMDNTSGSSDLAKKSANVLIKLVEKSVSLIQIKKVALLLKNAQPEMASIFNLVNNMMITIDKKKDQILKDIVKSYCKQFIEDFKTSDILIAKQTIRLIDNNATIITHSYSSTVLNTLLYVKNEKEFKVICTESRPKNEGIILANILGKYAINTNLIVDSAVFSFIPDADIILVGGDAITNNGLINKIGTKGLAIASQNHKIPIYALCSTIKFLPKNYQVDFNLKKNPDEILSKKISNVTAINYYFDCTPLKFLTGVITEKGIFNPIEIKETMKHQNIHSSLK